MPRIPVKTVLLIIAIASLVTAVYLLVLGVVNFRESRSAPYHTIRRNAIRQAMRQFGLMILMLGVTGGVFMLRRNVPQQLGLAFLPITEPRPTATSTPIPDLPPTITPQPAAASTMAVTATVAPTMTLSSTLDAEPTPAVDIYEVSTGITNNLLPAGAGTQFDAGLTRIYYWVEYDNMADGDSWRQVLLINGDTILDDQLAWDQGEEGTAYYFFDAPEGWPAGNYEIRFFTGDRLNDAIRFTLQ